MSKAPSSKLTSTVLSQIQENEYLRIKLIQLQKVNRQKDNFYLSIFHEQQKMTEKVMSELLLAEQKIKQFVRQRICNNWKDEYDNLADNITSYVNDVNSLIEQYQQTKERLQKKATNNNDLYDYYSNTLEECGKKFDQAQIIIEELNSKIEELKQIVLDLDQALEEKISIINQQRCQIIDLKQELNDKSELDFLRSTHQTDLKNNQSLKKTIRKLEKDNQALQRSNLQLGRLVNQLRKQQDEDKIKRETLEEDLSRLEKSIEELNNRINYQKSGSKEEQTNKNVGRAKIFKNNDTHHVNSMSILESKNNSNAPNQISLEDHHKLHNQNQLHLQKILQQQQTINNLTLQLSYNKKSIQNLETENKKLIQFQIQYINMENSYKREFAEMKQKILTTSKEIEFKDQQITGLQMERISGKEQSQDVMIQVEGLHQQLINKESQIKRLKHEHTLLQKKLQTIKKQNDFLLETNQEHVQNIQLLHKQKEQSKFHFQTLLQEFQQFVRESQYEKQLYIQQRKQSLALCSLQINENLPIPTKQAIQSQDSTDHNKMKRKNLLINLEEHQTIQERQSLKEFNAESERPLKQMDIIKTKKFNLQTFQQKTNPQISVCWSPKVGDIYNAIHQGRIPGTHRW